MQNQSPQVKCTKCDAAIPREHVLPEKAVAHCPTCDAIIEIADILQAAESLKSRKKVRYYFDPETNSETMEITQLPCRNAMMLSVLAIFFIIDILALCFVLYIKSFYPDETFTEFFTQNELADEISRLVYSFLVVNFVFLFSPIWAFFDWRVIRINNKTVHASGHWLFFRWQRTASRSELSFARYLSPELYLNLINDFASKAKNIRAVFLYTWLSVHNVLYQCALIGTLLLNVLALKLGKKSVWIGCYDIEGGQPLSRKINYFLFTVPDESEYIPSDLFTDYHNIKSTQTQFLGGVANFTCDVSLYCPKCGKQVAPQDVDFNAHTLYCCEESQPLDTATYVRRSSIDTEAETLNNSTEFTIEITDDLFRVERNPKLSKYQYYFELATAVFTVMFFYGMLGLMLYMFINEGKIASGIIITSIFGTCVSFMLTIICFQSFREAYSASTRWLFSVTSNELRFYAAVGKWERTVVIPRKNIVEAVLGKPASTESFKLQDKDLCKFTMIPDAVSGLWGPNSWYLLLTDGSNVPIVTHGCLFGTKSPETKTKNHEFNVWIIEQINLFLATHPIRKMVENKNVVSEPLIKKTVDAIEA
ncbi:MAG: hypothetical protein ACRC2T_06840 [Thermoguttaceae bacterium]